MTIAERARSLIGTPYLHQGRSRSGIDCVGFVAYAIDYPMDKIPPYSADPINGELEAALSAEFGAALLTNPTMDQLKHGDICAMQYRGPIRHVGIILNHPDRKNCAGVLTLIHSDRKSNAVTEHTLDFKWLRRIVKVWRLESN